MLLSQHHKHESQQARYDRLWLYKYVRGLQQLVL